MTPPSPIAPLLAEVAGQDRAAFSRLYDAMAGQLFGVLLRLLKDQGEAEDALQDVFVKVWHKAGQYRADARTAPEAWLVAIARNHALDKLRARRAPAEPLDTVAGDGLGERLADPSPSPEHHAMATESKTNLDRCLETLPLDRAAAVRGAYLDGDSYQTLAERFEVPLNTMRSWLRRALLKLRECLEP